MTVGRVLKTQYLAEKVDVLRCTSFAVDKEATKLEGCTCHEFILYETRDTTSWQERVARYRRESAGCPGARRHRQTPCVLPSTPSARGQRRWVPRRRGCPWTTTRIRRRRVWRARLGMCRMPGLRLAVRVVWGSSTTTRPRASVCAWDVTWVSIKMLWLRRHALGVLRVVMRVPPCANPRLLHVLRQVLENHALEA